MPRVLSIIAGAIFGMAGIFLMLLLSTGPCTDLTQIFIDPVSAISDIPLPNPGSKDFYGLDTDVCDSSPPVLDLLLFLFAPICMTLLISGALASRMSGERLATTGAIASTSAASLPLLLRLAILYSNGDLVNIGWRTCGVVLAEVGIAGGLGYLGGYLASRRPNLKFDTDASRRST